MRNEKRSPGGGQAPTGPETSNPLARYLTTCVARLVGRLCIVIVELRSRFGLTALESLPCNPTGSLHSQEGDMIDFVGINRAALAVLPSLLDR